MTVAALLLVASVAEAKKPRKGKKRGKPKSAEELFNPLLGVEHSKWLVGPIAYMAEPEEIERYLTLASDADAAAFIEAFWAKRNEGTPIFKETPQDVFEARKEEADKRFTEAASVGSKTDRGTIFVVYGEPKETYYDKPTVRGGLSPEVWQYGADAAPGLNGEAPDRRYRFIKLGDHTVFFEESMRRDPRLRDPFAESRIRNRP